MAEGKHDDSLSAFLGLKGKDRIFLTEEEAKSLSDDLWAGWEKRRRKGRRNNVDSETK